VTRRPLGGAARNADLGLLHETFFICAVTTILCIRTDLWLTHYPQLGGHGLHIAHLLYGGALMLLALAFLLTLLGRRVRWVGAVIGGIGFGFFIDELGKFVTADNNYFFRPAAGLIYLIFIGLFLASRAYQRRRGLNEDERVRNAFELIAEASVGPWQAGSRAHALALLDEIVGDGDVVRGHRPAEIDLAGARCHTYKVTRRGGCLSVCHSARGSLCKRWDGADRHEPCDEG